ncbi:hypothetical protein QOT17_005778 [Balamuthia mandrillaris]
MSAAGQSHLQQLQQQQQQQRTEFFRLPAMNSLQEALATIISLRQERDRLLGEPDLFDEEEEEDEDEDDDYQPEDEDGDELLHRYAAAFPRRGMLLLNELRSLLRQRQGCKLFDESEPFAHLRTEKQLERELDGEELQGMMLFFNYLYPFQEGPEKREAWKNVGAATSTTTTTETEMEMEMEMDTTETRSKENEKRRVFALLNDYRTLIRVRMHPVQHLYLDTKVLDDSRSAYDLQKRLGERRLRGALRLFHYAHPENVHFASQPISFTILFGAPPSAASSSFTPPPQRLLSLSGRRQQSPATAPPGSSGGRTSAASRSRASVASRSLFAP